ncbi:hypothetical protein DMENIID0001_130320 [Sergentomyia squamirostris]
MYYNQLEFLGTSLRKISCHNASVAPVATVFKEENEGSWDHTMEDDDVQDEENLVNPLEDTASNNGETAVTANDKFNTLIENVNAFMSSYTKANPRDPFFPYFEEKMRRLPEKVKNDLEIEFLKRVHEELRKLHDM